MALSFIEIIQRVSPRLGFRKPAAALTSQDLNIQIISEFGQEEGEELSRWHDWPILKQEYTVSTLGTVAQTAFPSNFDRMAEFAEIWNRSLNMKYDGPTDPAFWDQLKSSLVTATGNVGQWIIIGGVLQLFPAPTAGQTIAFTYIKNTWAMKADLTPQTRFLLDTDQPLLPDFLFPLGIRWRYRASRGLDYAEDMATYERSKERAAGKSKGGGRVIRKGGSGSSYRSTNTFPGVISG